MFSGLTKLNGITLTDNDLRSLPPGLFSGLTALQKIRLAGNKLSALPDGLFSGLTALTFVSLDRNTVDPLPLTVTLDKVGTDQVQAKVLAGAPRAVDFTVTVENGALDGGATTLSVAKGSVVGTSVTVTRTDGTTAAVTADVDLTTQPTEDPYTYVGGHTYAKATSGLPVTILPDTTNAAPSFISLETFEVEENATAVDTVEAEDSDTEDNIESYSITGGADEDFFSIVSTTGVLTFNAAPDFEDAQDQGFDNTYEVTVQATSGTGTREKTATQTITVTVTNAREQPAKPAKPTLAAVSGSSTSLTATWVEPDRNGGPAISGYDLQYREGTTGAWEDFAYSGTDVTTTITGLTANTEYQIHVRAKNGEADSDWSDPSDAARTNAETPTAPTITGVAVTSTPLLTSSGGSTPDTYGERETIRFTVTFSARVAVNGDPHFTFWLGNSGAEQEVDAPFESGSGSAALVFAYIVQSTDEDDDGIFLGDGSNFNNRHGPVALDPGDSIVAVTGGADADLAWTGGGTQSRHKVDGSRGPNNPPVFSGDSTTREVANDSRAGTRVGAPVTATDLDNDQLAYSLEDHNPNLFIISPSSAYIFTGSNGNYSCASYRVTVKAEDENGATDTIAVTINITGLETGFTESEHCTDGPTEDGDGPDLVVISPSVSVSSPVAGGATFVLTARVRNAGTEESPDMMLRVYRSGDATITTADTLVHTSPSMSGLAASGERLSVVQLVAPEDPGTYYYGVCVDAVADEADTTNNCSDSVEVTVAGEPPEDDGPPEGDDDDDGPGPGPDSDPDPDPEPDLSVDAASVSDDSPVAGATFTFSATVRNAGDTDSPATILRYYRSTDATISTADSEEGNDAVGALAASASSSESVELTAPSTPGTYYYGACVDAVSGEADTTNNCSTAAQVDVSEAEPVPAPALPLLGQLLLALGLAAGGAGLARRRGAPTA